MENTNLTGSPYYDRYDDTKKYTKLMFMPGKVQQSREMVEVQSMHLDFLKRLGDSMLKDGSIIDGCALVIKDNRAIISKGKIYLHGIVRDIDDTEVKISGKGSEIIGVKINRSIVTEVDDSSLRDPAQGYDNYNQSGAHRLKETVVVTVNDSESAALYEMENGELLSVSEEKPQDNKWVDLMAKRTYDESGNYKVKGLTLLDKGISDNNHVYISLESGRAYIQGYEVNRPASTTIKLDKSLSTRQVTSEPKIYKDGTNSYMLNNNPVKRISKIVAIVEVSQTITRGNIGGGLDYLPKKPVVSITSVASPALGITYTQGVDYRLNNDGIDWSLSGIEPDIGSSYKVTWTYNKVLEYGADYMLKELADDEFSVVFGEGDKPVNGTSFNVDYEFYLARKDLICIDANGRIIVLQGQPDFEKSVFAPANYNAELFPLGAVTLPPNGNTPSITNQNITAISVEKLHAIVKRIEDMEYNQAISDLDNEAMDGEQATLLKGVFTDGFIGFTKCDLAHPDFDSALDVINRELTLPSSFCQYVPAINAGSKARATKRLATAPYTEVVGIEQNIATGMMKINPYSAYTDTPSVELDPSVDNWIDNSYITINGATVTINKTTTIGSSYTTTRDVVTDKIVDSIITYMRQTLVDIVATKFPPLTDLIRARFDGVSVDLVPESNAYRGSLVGTVKADSGGTVKASFTIPPNILTGTRELELTSDNLPSLIGTAKFTANGIHRETQTTVY